ncbi:accessory gene regulator ArgB-like protein [Cohnella zeiphila]|uniref:Accessory gene regulator B family protein n=1 Tax=Cohnella zeiphila TaxID=2761120 RepID=A0A7X0SJK6_9BACL|nr:accessory gene regulator B family protein [Cohnella zeiphila]MBB6731180.1 accessory gene regulator B family protein [Cohnella zeiphila]
MIERLALSIATSIKKVDAEQTPSIEVMKFSLITILHTLATVLIVFILSWVTGKPLVTMYGMGYFMLLRFFSGGYHIQSSSLCTVLSVLLMLAAPFIPLGDHWVLIANIVNVVMMLVFSPSNIKGFAQIPEKYFPILKLVSVAIVCANFWLQDPTLAILTIFQSILLLFKQEGGESA